MKLAGYTLKLEKKASFTGLEAIVISVVAILVALFLVGFIFLQAGVDPAKGYQAMFTYAFANPFGAPLTINRAVFILLSTFAFIVPIRAGLWNIGMSGQLYFGALTAFGVAYVFGARTSGANLSGAIVIPLMIVGGAIGGGLAGAIPGVLKGKFNTNEIVVTMMLNFIGYWVVAHMIKEGGPFMGSGGEGEGFKLPASIQAPIVSGVSVLTLVIALLLAVLLYVLFTRTRLGYQIRAFGLSPAAARYAGISPFQIALITFVIGGALAGLAGYHYFGTTPNLNQIPKNYGDFGDMAFYGIICGLISQGNPLAAIPLALLFGGLTSGGRYVQGKLHLSYGIDYALLGVLMITLVAFQFFFRYRVVFKKES
ncbi:MAG: ABC transporter permease [Anaerolineales bacterium]|nr:ABC transporter permease [Anaerolineales bacterium]